MKPHVHSLSPAHPPVLSRGRRAPLLLAPFLFAWFLTSLTHASLQIGWGGFNQWNNLGAVATGLNLFAGVEIDVRATKDGVVIGLHDATLDRETNASGPIADHTWAQLAHVRNAQGDSLSRLSEMLPLVLQRQGVVIIDARDVPVEAMRASLEEAAFPHQFAKFFVLDHQQGNAYIRTFPHAEVFFKTYALPSSLDRGLFLYDLVQRGYAGLGFPTWSEMPSDSLMDKLRAFQLSTISFVVRDQAEADASVAAGIDYVISNGNVYRFPHPSVDRPIITSLTFVNECLCLETKISQSFRRLVLEEFHNPSLGTDVPLGWSPNFHYVPERLALGHYRFVIPVHQLPGALYRLRVTR